MIDVLLESTLSPNEVLRMKSLNLLLDIFSKPEALQEFLEKLVLVSSEFEVEQLKLLMKSSLALDFAYLRLISSEREQVTQMIAIQKILSQNLKSAKDDLRSRNPYSEILNYFKITNKGRNKAMCGIITASLQKTHAKPSRTFQLLNQQLRIVSILVKVLDFISDSGSYDQTLLKPRAKLKQKVIKYLTMVGMDNTQIKNEIFIQL